LGDSRTLEECAELVQYYPDHEEETRGRRGWTYVTRPYLPSADAVRRGAVRLVRVVAFS